MRYLVDSDWVMDGLANVPTAVAVLDELIADGLAVSIVTYGEVFEGACGIPDPPAQLAVFWTYLTNFIALPLTDPIMEIFAQTRADLRSLRQLIPDTDLQIAATAIYHDLTLLLRHVRHFHRIPHVRLYDAN